MFQTTNQSNTCGGKVLGLETGPLRSGKMWKRKVVSTGQNRNMPRKKKKMFGKVLETKKCIENCFWEKYWKKNCVD